MDADERPRVLATICARGGSKGIPGKNARSVGGKPLLGYAIESARECPLIGHIVVSTDSEEIAAIAEDLGVPVPFRRPPELATDTAGKVEAIRHATEYVEEHDGFYPEIVADLDVGVPLRSPEDVTACVEVLLAHPDLDAAVTVFEPDRNPYFNMIEFEGERVRLVKPPPKGLVRRQDAPPVYGVSPSVFAWRRGSFGSARHLFEGSWGACIVPKDRAVDIDEEINFQFVEFMLQRQGGVLSP